MSDEEVDIGPGADVDMDDDPSIKRRGRGFDPKSEGPATDGVKHSGQFDVLMDDKGTKEDDRDRGITSGERAAKSIEGYIIIVTGIDEEATEEEVTDKFADYGKVRSIHLNLDRRTGFVKGYALLEYEQLEEAKGAIEACREGLTLMDKPLKSDFAFVQPPASALRPRGATGGGRGQRNRSRSPTRR